MIAKEFVSFQFRIIKSVFTEQHPRISGTSCESTQGVYYLILEIVALYALQPPHHRPVAAVARVGQNDHERTRLHQVVAF